MYKTTQGWLESYTNKALLSNINNNFDYLIDIYCSLWETTPKKGCWSWSLWPSPMPPLCGGYPLKEFLFIWNPSPPYHCSAVYGKCTGLGGHKCTVCVRPETQRLIVWVLLWSLDVVSLNKAHCLNPNSLWFAYIYHNVGQPKLCMYWFL